MKNIALALLLLFSTFAGAVAEPNPAEYTVNVHVSASYMVSERDNNLYVQKLDVVIDGKKYELESEGVGMILALGDYKAKLVKDEHKTPYDSLQVYEFLFSDKKTRKFEVVGQTE
jgi:hypothetical protein